MEKKSVRFSNNLDKEFAAEVRSRVNQYFESNGINPSSNSHMKIKTVVMALAYLGPFSLIILGLSESFWYYSGLWLLMGLGMAGVGFTIMHDANHNSYSTRSSINKILGFSMYALGGSPVNWKIQHNMLHHGFTNITGMDEDIDAGKLLRMSPHQTLYKFHRFQHYYAWFLYSIMTIYWFTGKDILQMNRYRRMGLLSQQKTSFSRLMSFLILSKVVYLAIVLGLPVLFSAIPWWQTVLLFLSMHLLAGLLLGLVFQPAHVVDSSEYPMPDENGKIQSNWVIHQMRTTANFSPKNKILSWLIGGLNFQVEHHLFANVCHVHYHKISPIVQSVAAEYGLPYHVNRSFFGAIANHARLLKHLGRNA